jgi:hypothetical protein
LRPGDSSARGGTVKYAVLRDHAASTSTALLGAIAARDWLITGELVRVKIDNPSTRTLRSDGGKGEAAGKSEIFGPRRTGGGPPPAALKRLESDGFDRLAFESPDSAPCEAVHFYLYCAMPPRQQNCPQR